MRHYLKSGIAAFLVLLLCQCSDKGSGPSTGIRLGEEAALGVGRSTMVSGEDLRVTLLAVTADTRCPSGIECNWAGLAEIELELQKGNQSPVRAYLVISSAPHGRGYRRKEVLGYMIEMRDLLPYPSSADSSLADAEYKALLIITKASVAPPALLDEVEITGVPPDSILGQGYSISSAQVDADTLSIEFRVPNCGRHYFWLFMSPAVFGDSLPAQVDIYVKHIQIGDSCTSFSSYRASYNIQAIAALYVQARGHLDPMVVNLHEHPITGTEQVRQLTYLPHGELPNHSPEIDPPGHMYVAVASSLLVTVTGHDPYDSPIVLSAGVLPDHSSFEDRENGTGLFRFQPDSSQVGDHAIWFYVSNHIAVDSALMTVTVGENHPPTLNPIGDRHVLEGAELRFEVSSSDPDSTITSISAIGLPRGATASNGGNGIGLFIFYPDYQQAGVYSVLFVASDGQLSDSETVNITVENVNRAPVLQPIGNKSVLIGSLLEFRISATDVDSTIPVLAAVDAPVGAVFVDSGNGAGFFNLRPSEQQIGEYALMVIASDGQLADTEMVGIAVKDTNHAPVLQPIGNKSALTDSLLEFRVSATDIDSTIPVLSVVGTPPNATFVDSSNGAGLFSFRPAAEQVGVLSISVIASDGSMADTEIVLINVSVGGGLVILPIPPQSVREGDSLILEVNAAGDEGNAKITNLTIEPLDPHLCRNPDNTSSTWIRDDKAVLRFAPDFTRAGAYEISVKATNGIASVATNVPLTVIESGPHAPVFFQPESEATIPGRSVKVSVYAPDPDDRSEGAPLFSSPNLPIGAALTSVGSEASISYVPPPGDVGAHEIMVIATDEQDPGLTDTINVSIHVKDPLDNSGELMPLAIGNYWVYEKHTFSTTIWPGPCGIWRRTVSTTVDSVSVVDSYVENQKTWWRLSSSLPTVENVATFDVTTSHDSVFSSRGLIYVLAGTTAVPYRPYSLAQGFSDSGAVPAVGYKSYVRYNSWSYIRSIGDDHVVIIAPGIGITYASEHGYRPNPMPCDWEPCSGGWEIRRLLRYHVQ
jgi:hypothetical protein